MQDLVPTTTTDSMHHPQVQAQEISNSNFNGLGTAILLNNDVGTTISNTVVANGDVGVAIGTQNTANHVIDTMTISNVNTGISAAGMEKYP